MIDTLLVDLEQSVAGEVRDNGGIDFADTDDHRSYGVVDDVVRRVLRTGGTLLAVRGNEIAAGQPAAGILRHPILADELNSANS